MLQVSADGGMTTEEAAGTATRGTTTVEEAEGVVADTGDVSTNNNKNAYTELPRHVRNGGFGCTIFQIGNAFLKLKKKNYPCCLPPLLTGKVQEN